MTPTNSFNDLATRDIEIERNGVTKTFRVRELNGEEGSKIFNTTKPNGKRDPEKARKLDSRLIAATVSEVTADGLRPVSFDEAANMALRLRRELIIAAMDINGLNDEDEDEKN